MRDAPPQTVAFTSLTVWANFAPRVFHDQTEPCRSATPKALVHRPRKPLGVSESPPFPVSRYSRCEPSDALDALGVDGWTAYIGATHEDHHDLGGCLAALRGKATWVGMIGARSRTEGRLAALRAGGASEEELARLHLSPGDPSLGKAPFEVATGILADIMKAFARIGASS